MDVTVGICTWNRARLLDATLAQMCNLRIPPGVAWELLVVDNNSTDETPAVIERYVGRLPVRRLVERRQGTSYAKNCVLAHAAGELLLWTDDDVLVDEEWLAAYVSAAARWPNAGYFGGLITPRFEREPPSWFHKNEHVLSPAMALRDLGPNEHELAGSEPPFGANMAFRRAAFSSRTFDVRLGPHANDQIRGEETKYCRELAADGFQGIWVPAAKVQHFVLAHRLTARFIRDYWAGVGRTEVRKENASGIGTPRWVYKALVQSYAKYLWKRATGSPEWVPSLMAVSRLRGVRLEYRTRPEVQS
jgi:glycosyltransferase involved in cell wall biosynthesis